jgi:DNA mismatch endonuclease (patch repair protein)
MPDVVDRATRSRMMRGMKGANTQPELRVRRRFRAAGLRYRLRSKDLPGRPDIVFRRIRTVVFVHGCFWHQHPGCRYATTPATNADFWKAKLQSNVVRDRRVEGRLRDDEWFVVTLWECSSDEAVDQVVDAISERTGQLPRG